MDSIDSEHSHCYRSFSLVTLLSREQCHAGKNDPVDEEVENARREQSNRIPLGLGGGQVRIGSTCRDSLSSARFSQEKLGSDANSDGKGSVVLWLLSIIFSVK